MNTMIPVENFAGLLAFVLVTTATPGPNNLMLMASGLRFGFGATVPLMIGINLGHGFLSLMVGAGLGAALLALPGAEWVMKGASLAYMLWLAAKLLRAGPPGAGDAGAQPLTFLNGAAFQWINPKAWAMALGAMSLWAAGGGWAAVLTVVASQVLIGLPCIALWAWMGERMAGWLRTPARLRAFNVSMAVALVASILPVLWHEF